MGTPMRPSGKPATGPGPKATPVPQKPLPATGPGGGGAGIPTPGKPGAQAVVGVGGGKAKNIKQAAPIIPAATGPKGVTDNPANPGKPRPSHYSAPAADGSNVSIPPQFGGPGPIQSVTGVNTAPLGIGTAQPAFHGGE